jgi:ABC-type sugar transport system ATPase subunit
LVGENGAGKSTLMKVLTGVHAEYDGEILLDGEPIHFTNTRETLEKGISIVFQELNLCPNLSAMENLFLGNELCAKGGLLSYRRMHEETSAAFRNLRVVIDPKAIVRNLSVAQQQMIEVAKALGHHTRILIMDEPTSSLTQEETQSLYRIMRELKERGVAVVFISHKLNEVLTITDRVVCMRDGTVSGEIATCDATEEKLVKMMVGREIDQLYGGRHAKPSPDVVLEVRNLSGPPNIQDVSFKLHRGEILGFAGLIGAGRTDIALLLIGARKKTGGQVLLNGREIAIHHPSDAVAHGIGYASEDRKRFGLVLRMTVRENTTMPIHRAILNRFGLIDAAKENKVADRSIADLRIKVSGREQVTRNLSGGNQQKVVIAKWLAINPKILILDEPTRGIDVNAKAEVHKIIADLADRGVAIIVISSELPEVLTVADRIVVISGGRLTADLPRSEASEEAIMTAAVS